MVAKLLKNINFILIGLLFLIFLISLAMTTNRTYTFFSDANEETKMVTVSDVSLEPINVSAEDLPSCVESIRYLPEVDDTFTSCYAEIVCDGDVQKVLNQCQQNESGLSCDTESCLSVPEWTKQAAEACGCS